MANQHPTGRHSAGRKGVWEQQPSQRPEERSPRDDPRDRHERGESGSRSGSVEYQGQGQSGYGAGRRADPATGMQNWPDALPTAGSFEDRHHELHVDDRFTGRGRSPYRQDPDARTLGDVPVHDSYRGRDFESERRTLTQRHGRAGLAAHRSDERLSYPAGAYGGSAEARADAPDAERHVHPGTGPHRGKGPVGYQRSDEQLRERVCESLADDDQLDASQIEVAVSSGEVMLSGAVDDRRAKRDAEDCAASVPGVRDVQNRLRVRDRLAATPSE